MTRGRLRCSPGQAPVLRALPPQPLRARSHHLRRATRPSRVARSRSGTGGPREPPGVVETPASGTWGPGSWARCRGRRRPRAERAPNSSGVSPMWSGRARDAAIEAAEECHRELALRGLALRSRPASSSARPDALLGPRLRRRARVLGFARQLERGLSSVAFGGRGALGAVRDSPPRPCARAPGALLLRHGLRVARSASSAPFSASARAPAAAVALLLGRRRARRSPARPSLHVCLVRASSA